MSSVASLEALKELIGPEVYNRSDNVLQHADAFLRKHPLATKKQVVHVINKWHRYLSYAHRKGSLVEQKEHRRQQKELVSKQVDFYSQMLDRGPGDMTPKMKEDLAEMQQLEDSLQERYLRLEQEKEKVTQKVVDRSLSRSRSRSRSPVRGDRKVDFYRQMLDRGPGEMTPKMEEHLAEMQQLEDSLQERYLRLEQEKEKVNQKVVDRSLSRSRSRSRSPVQGDRRSRSRSPNQEI
jgi:hypothetical protein